MSAADGRSLVTTHPVPRGLSVLLAAFQHSFANGFDISKPKDARTTLTARNPMLRQISQAISNFAGLADFINLRVDTDTDLARTGSIQNALDTADTKIDHAYPHPDRTDSFGPLEFRCGPRRR